MRDAGPRAEPVPLREAGIEGTLDDSCEAPAPAQEPLARNRLAGAPGNPLVVTVAVLMQAG